MNKPEANKSYLLVGGSNVKSIAAGNTWAESEVKPEKPVHKWGQSELPYLELKKRIKDILVSIKESVFVEGYRASDEEAFGIMMAQYFGWDGYAIAEASGNALEEANFHGWAKILRDTELMDHVAKGGK